MYRKHLTTRICVLMSAVTLSGSAAMAGPYPLEQLMAWLDVAYAKFDAIEATIDSLEQQASDIAEKMADVKKRIEKGEASAEKLRAELQELSDAHEAIVERLAEARAERQDLLNYIEWLRIQVVAWQTIKNPGPT